MIKFIDAKENLSVQVHPDDFFAKNNGNDCGKTEMWYIIDCKENSNIVCGFNEKVNKENLSSILYSNKIEVFLDNYAQKDHNYSNETYESLAQKLENNKISIKKHHIYTSEKLSNILFLILEEVVRAENLPIKECQSCGKYFIPTSRQDEIYCEFPDEKGKTCKEKGASLTYKKNLESIPALLEYRRSYQKKIMIVSRNKENKQLKKDFDKWKKEAQARIKLFKQGKLEEEKLYNWMIENK